MLEVKPFFHGDKRFRELCERRFQRNSDFDLQAETILRNVREDGDNALVELIRRHDCPSLELGHLRVPEDEVNEARERVSEQFLTALSLARVNLRKFHEYQRRRGYVHDDEDGVRLSRHVRPLSRVGICCQESFLALLACAVPAQVAGVGEIAVAARPRLDGTLDPRLLATAKVLGINTVFRMSGAEAVAAFAYGTATVERADKIVGPGGPTAEAAKAGLWGMVGTAPAGIFSELAVIADDSANARFIAADLYAQATNDDGRGALALFACDRLLAEAVRIELNRMAEDEPAVAGILERRGLLAVCRDLGEAVAAANRLAPARLLLSVHDVDRGLADIETAGSVYLGNWTPEAAGDFFSGANCLLPGHGRAAYSSGAAVDDYVRETTVIEYGPERLGRTGRHILTLAEEDGKSGPARAVRERLELLQRLRG